MVQIEFLKLEEFLTGLQKSQKKLMEIAQKNIKKQQLKINIWLEKKCLNFQKTHNY